MRNEKDNPRSQQEAVELLIEQLYDGAPDQKHRTRALYEIARQLSILVDLQATPAQLKTINKRMADAKAWFHNADVAGQAVE